MSASSQDEDGHLSDSRSSGLEWPPRPQSQMQNYFAPPFYGRPPTPLPPSPSLTSLLRPSRPTTPDASDEDAAPAPVPRAAAQVPTYEYYGFVLYLLSSLTFVLWLLWSYLPAPLLHGLGITYYPNRWWALAIPAFLVMALCYVYVALAAYNTELLTVPLASVETVVDGAGKLAVIDAKGRLRGSSRRERRCDAGGRLRWREIWNEGTDAVMDVPLAGVCEVLYGEGREGGTRCEGWMECVGWRGGV